MLVGAPVVGNSRQSRSVESADVRAGIARSVAESKSKSPSTVRAYASDWRRFDTWCARHEHQGLPPDRLVVAAYLTDAADTLIDSGQRAYAPATLSRWVAAIGHRHQVAGYRMPTADPIATATLFGIRQSCAAAGERPLREMAPLLTSDIVTIVAQARDAVTGWAGKLLERRDTALLLTGLRVRSGVANWSASTAATSLCTVSTGCTFDCDGRRPTRTVPGVKALPITVSRVSCPPLCGGCRS